MTGAGGSRAVTTGRITRVTLPVIYAGAGLRLLALLRNSDDPAVRDLGIALAAVAAAGSTLPPSSLASVESWLGDANYARFLSQIGTVVGAGYGDAALLRSAYAAMEAGGRLHARRRRMIGTLLIMSALFSRDRAIAGELQNPTERLYTAPVALYWVTFSAFMVRTAGELSHLALRTSRLTREEYLRAGLRAVGVGGLVMSGFYGQYATCVVGRLVFPRLPGPLRGVPAQGVIGGAAAVMCLGASLPGAAWRWKRARQRLLDMRASFGLAPLWQHFRYRDPQVTLEVTALGAADVRLHRRVIEVLDGFDRLIGGHDPHGAMYQVVHAVAAEHGFGGEDVLALYRATLVSVSVAQAGSGVSNSAEFSAPALAASSLHADYRGEARRLLRAAQLLNHPLSRRLATTRPWDARSEAGPQI